MATEPRGYTKKESNRARQPIMAGQKGLTGTLDGTTTVEIIKLGMVAQKLTVQGTGTLAGDFEVSANGTDFVAGGAFTVAGLTSYNTHNCVAVRITRTSGTGKASVLAV